MAIRYGCPVCGTSGADQHEPGDAICQMMLTERAAKCRDD